MIDSVKVKKMRQDAGLTQRALSIKADVTIPMISQIENGYDRLSVTIIEKLAAALNVEPKELLK